VVPSECAVWVSLSGESTTITDAIAECSMKHGRASFRVRSTQSGETIMRRRLISSLLCLAAVLWAIPALGAGYWNMPSSVYQCLGYGCGAGYHAPLLLGPVSCDGWLDTNVRRLPCAPCVQHPSPCNGNCNRALLNQPGTLEPALHPPAEEQAVPTSAAYHPLLRY
jgi:hypothetical protein